MFSTADKNMSLIKLLLDHGADINCENDDGETLLIAAVKQNKVELVKYLLIACKVDVNETNKHGGTALMAAASKNNLDMCKLLIEHGADTKLEDDSGNTAVLYAAKYNTSTTFSFSGKTGWGQSK